MSYSQATKLPDFQLFQWSVPDAPNPRLSAPVNATATTLKFTSPPLDKDGTVIAKAFLMGIRNSDSYVETVLVPAGEMSVDGLTATNVIRGIRLEALDWTTGDTDLAVAHKSGDKVFCNISGVWGALVTGVLQGTVATGAADFVMGTEAGAGGETTTIYRTTTAGVKLGIFRWTSDKAQYSNDGSVWVNIEDVSASNLINITSADTTPGYLDDKVTVSSGAGATVTKSVTSPGGNEKLNIDVALDVSTAGIEEHAIYTPAYLTGGGSAEGTFSNWLAVLDGSFRITVDGAAVNVDAIDFTGVGDMDDVAAIIQVALRAATSGTETVVWSTDHFVITSADISSSSAITVTETSTGTVGTDISGAGASDWMDCDVGNGTVTDAVRDDTADAGKLVNLKSTGRLDGGFMPDNLLAAAETGSTDITGTELETLSDGSDADALHTHNSLENTYTLGTQLFDGDWMTFQLPLDNTNYDWSDSNAGFSIYANYPYSKVITAGAANGQILARFIKHGAAFGNLSYSDAKGIRCKLFGGPVSAVDDDMSWGFSPDTAADALGAYFFWDDSETKLYAHTGTGAAQTDTDITGALTIENAPHVYEIYYNGSTACYFYIDGNLVATHTTNLPVAATLISFGWRIKANADVFASTEPIVSYQI